MHKNTVTNLLNDGKIQLEFLKNSQKETGKIILFHLFIKFFQKSRL